MAEDSFRILELISRSSTTSVYKAHQNVLDRTVLLKVLHKHLLKDHDLVARFSREAKACAMLHSENIVQVYDLTEIEGAPAIVMEYVEGQSLEDALLDEKTRSGEMFRKVAVSVLNALAYAHERGVIHRDIKPGNILVSAAGTIKVTDFGLAALTGSPSLTVDGSLIGTPAFMSPEQSRGETVDGRSDLFSLGVTLVEILTGKKILAGRSYAECISKIQSFTPDSLNGLAIPPDDLEFLKRILAPDRENRFATAEEALQFLSGPSTEHGETPRRSAGGKNKAGMKRFVAAGIALVLVIVAGLSFVLTKSPQKTDNSLTSKVENTLPGGSSSPEKNNDTSTAGRGKENRSNDAIKGDVSQIPHDIRKPAPEKVDGLTGTVRPGATTVADSGYISVACTPWAKVFIDNEYAGMTPISGSIPVPAGKHTVTFNNPYYVTIVREVNVNPRALSYVDANFLKDAGYIYVHVDPWARVYVDDQLRETTPSTKPIIVSAGTRHIRIENPAFHDILKDITVKAGDTLRLNFNFAKPNEN